MRCSAVMCPSLSYGLDDRGTRVCWFHDLGLRSALTITETGATEHMYAYIISICCLPSQVTRGCDVTLRHVNFPPPHTHTHTHSHIHVIGVRSVITAGWLVTDPPGLSAQPVLSVARTLIDTAIAFRRLAMDT